MRLSFFLVKPSVDFNKVEQIIEPPARGQLHSYRVTSFSGERDSLFLKESRVSPPRWLELIEGHVEDGLVPVLGASSAGALLVPAGEDLLAVTFGYGRHLVRKEAVVQDFGLKVVLNEIDPAQIKSVDARTFDELLIHTKRGVSKDSPLSAFDLDSSRDLLRAVSGRSAPGGLGALSGSAALALNREITLPQLPELGTKLVAAYNSDRYQENFKVIDQMRGEQDPEVITALDNTLLAALRKGGDALATIHLAIPEAVDWQRISGVRFSLKRKHHQSMADPRITVYRELRPAEKIDLKRLRTDKVEAISALNEDELYDKWSVYDCLVFEAEHDEHLYVLSGGQWYRIDHSFREEVESFVNEVPELSLELPSPNMESREDEYNAAAAEAIGGLCIDDKTVSTGGIDRAEICDILTRDGILVHVKKRGRSSTLSHLFAQGVTSCKLLLNDQAFLDDARELVAGLDPSFSELLPEKRGERERIKVAYVVLSRGQRPERPYGLPFFSMVNLRGAVEWLRAAGVEVFAKEVKEGQAETQSG